MIYTRRTFVKLAVAGFARINSKVGGVTIGAQTYSFRDRPLEACIVGMKEVRLGEAELWSGHLEPKDPAALKIWRLNPPLDHLHQVRKQFDDAGIQLYAFNYSFNEKFTDEEIARGFDMAKALGVKYITASSNVSTARRIDPFAQKHQIYVAMHNHSNIKPNEFARPEDFEEAMRGASKYIAINLDIGHFTAAGYDPVSFLEQNHEHIITLHIKDRKKSQGDNVPFGQGDTKIREVLQLLKTKKYPIPANIEYEYKGGDTIEEMKKCFEYCKSALS